MTAYRAAIGREAPRDQIIDTRDFRSEMAVVDLRSQRPSCSEFIALVRRELLIRNYKKNTIKPYLSAVTSLLRWSGRLPHEMDREMVRKYLLYLVESDKGAARGRHDSTVNVPEERPIAGSDDRPDQSRDGGLVQLLSSLYVEHL